MVIAAQSERNGRRVANIVISIGGKAVLTSTVNNVKGKQVDEGMDTEIQHVCQTNLLSTQTLKSQIGRKMKLVALLGIQHLVLIIQMAVNQSSRLVDIMLTSQSVTVMTLSYHCSVFLIMQKRWKSNVRFNA
jgi:hypothetical protein